MGSSGRIDTTLSYVGAPAKNEPGDVISPILQQDSRHVIRSRQEGRGRASRRYIRLANEISFESSTDSVANPPSGRMTLFSVLDPDKNQL